MSLYLPGWEEQQEACMSHRIKTQNVIPERVVTLCLKMQKPNWASKLPVLKSSFNDSKTKSFLRRLYYSIIELLLFDISSELPLIHFESIPH